MPVTQVWERSLLVHYTTLSDLAKSNPHRITTVISLCSEPVRVKLLGINYLRFPLTDNRGILIGEFDRIIDAIGENVRWGRVLDPLLWRYGAVANPDCGVDGCLWVQEYR